MNRLALNTRTIHDAATTGEVEVALFYIDHPSLDAPVRLSTDNTERLSDAPPSYGTRSTWMDSNPATEPFLFVLVSTEQPSDLEDTPAAAEIVLSNVDSRIADELRSVTSRATVHMAVVFASAPDAVVVQYRDMKLVGASGDTGEVTMSFSRAPIEEEIVPMDRFTKQRFPGLYR